jgi:hypothetical protein
MKILGAIIAGGLSTRFGSDNPFNRRRVSALQVAVAPQAFAANLNVAFWKTPVEPSPSAGLGRRGERNALTSRAANGMQLPGGAPGEAEKMQPRLPNIWPVTSTARVDWPPRSQKKHGLCESGVRKWMIDHLQALTRNKVDRRTPDISSNPRRKSSIDCHSRARTEGPPAPRCSWRGRSG